jgi:hypothetical protein
MAIVADRTMRSIGPGGMTNGERDAAGVLLKAWRVAVYRAIRAARGNAMRLHTKLALVVVLAVASTGAAVQYVWQAREAAQTAPAAATSRSSVPLALPLP